MNAFIRKLVCTVVGLAVVIGGMAFFAMITPVA